MLTICALIAVRNEAPYLRVLLPLLAQQCIDAVVLDNESTDDSARICAELVGRPVVASERLPFRGFFSLSEQLAAKRRICGELTHDWVVHQDADEILEHHESGTTLRGAIEQAAAGSFTALDFDEFVFLPEPGEDYAERDYYREMLRYYFFAPHPSRLNRAWKRELLLDNTFSGGHRLAGAGLALDPRTHVLRHYIALSEPHARRKYRDRRFDPNELVRGWHSNRLAIAADRLAPPATSAHLHRLERYDARPLRRDRPVAAHYWEWDGEPSAAVP